jgi:nicotinamide mononucleotide transporter
LNISTDLIGAMLSFVSCYFYIKEKPFAWLISLSAIPFDIAMDLSIGVYGDLFLQFIYFILLLYGWYAWRKGDSVAQALPITRMHSKQFYTLAILAVLQIIAVWTSINYYTHSNVALLDSSVTVLSLVACWLLSRKIMESWLLWILIDLLYVSLYAYKQMPFHGFVSLFDAVICIIGYSYWIREYGTHLKTTVLVPATIQ